MPDVASECYRPDSDKWEYIPDMQDRRSGVGVIAHGPYVYAIGGFNGVARMKSAERYDVLLRKWSYIPDMHQKRSNFAVAILNDIIYVIGGFDGNKTNNDVECYNPATNAWTAVCGSMNIVRSGSSATVLSELPGRERYLDAVSDPGARPTASQMDSQRPIGDDGKHASVEIDGGVDLYIKSDRCRFPRDILFVFGGWSIGEPTCSVEMYNASADLWVRKCRYMLYK